MKNVRELLFLYSFFKVVLLLPVKPGGQSQWKRSACPTSEVQVPP